MAKWELPVCVYLKDENNALTIVVHLQRFAKEKGLDLNDVRVSFSEDHRDGTKAMFIKRK